MESIGEFRKTTKNSLTHVQRLPAAAAAAACGRRRAGILAAKQTWRTPGDEAGCNNFLAMAFCSLLLPLLVAAAPSAADTVDVALFCDTGTREDSLLYRPDVGGDHVRREECDAGRAAIDAINDKSDGAFDGLLPDTQLVPYVLFYNSSRCEPGNQEMRMAWLDTGVLPVASIGPGSDECVEQAELFIHIYAVGAGSVVLSEASTGTDVYCPRLVRLSSPERVRNEALAAVASHYGWARVAIVYDATDAWASDAARQFGVGLEARGGTILGDACVKEAGIAAAACTRLDEAGDLTGIRFESMSAAVADSVLDAIVATGARIIYIAARPADQRTLYERIAQTGKCSGAGYGLLSAWLSDDLFLGSDGTASADAVAGARGLLLPRETVDTTGTVAQTFLDARAAGLDPTVCGGDPVEGRYCDGDGDAATLGGYGPQIVDAVYTLAKALDTMEAADRQDPNDLDHAIEDLEDFEGFSGTVSLNDYEERDGPMTIVNLQLSPAGEPVFVNVGKVQGGAFALDSGAAVIFPGGTSDVPADGDTFDVFSNHHGLPVAPNGALAAGPGRALPAALGLALSWAFSQIRY